MERTVIIHGKHYSISKLLGHGKGGYSYLAFHNGAPVVIKQIHHEPCDYYTFGNKIEAEQHDYNLLKDAGIRIPEMIDIDIENEYIVKEYIEGNTVFELIKENNPVSVYIEQAKEMAAKAKDAGLNIDYFPTNFVVHGDLIYYVDYECNAYMEEWSFENWGITYWSRTAEFEAFLREHHS
ncbi:MAG: hypothetical protein IJ225_08535 [Solobacterium sp.]|nr:hypothetical protein [Solobacterium sp.]